ncbi:MAG: methyltransferase domain-containing protein [Patescibacteria group bacterium]|nr:methyltransferase domain-containing protein [Patescibacteria group bacterium]
MPYLSTVYSEAVRPKTEYPRQLARRLIEKFDLRPDMRLLDVGCGRGDFAGAFLAEGLAVDGVDREAAEGFPPGVTFTSSDVAQTLPYPDGTFDVVFSKSVVEHMVDPELFVRENLRVLKHDGLLICMTPDWKTTLYIFYDDHTHVRPLTVLGMQDLLTISGARDVVSEIFYQLPVLWRYPWLIVFSKLLQIAGPVKKLHKNKFVRWSRELMVLGYARK